MIEFEIDIPDDLKKLNLAANYERARKQHLVPAMEKSVDAARQAVLPMVPIGATGEARRSIVSNVGQTPYQTIGKVTSSMRRPNVYIYVMNAGRPAGKRKADSRKLEPWVQAKGLASDPTAVKRIAFLIARAIQKKGVKGLSFMWAGLDRVKSRVESYHRQAVEAIARELGHA